MTRCLAGLLVLVLVLPGTGTADAWAQQQHEPSGLHGDGHAQMHHVYKHWHPPQNANTSCCDDSDCRPTRAYVDDDGQWRAWNGARWLLVPSDRVLPMDFARDGRSHICEKLDFIYCFAPGSPKS
jgi:hypothetical protein